MSVHFLLSRLRADRGSHPHVSELLWRKRGGLSHRSPNIPFLRAAPTSPQLPRGHDLATQQTLIHCHSSVQGKRSYHAFETNKSLFKKAKLSFPGLFAQLSTGASGCHVAAHTDPRLMHDCGCVQVSKVHHSRPQPRTPGTGHRLFASTPRLSSHSVDAIPSVCDCEEGDFV